LPRLVKPSDGKDLPVRKRSSSVTSKTTSCACSARCPDLSSDFYLLMHEDMKETPRVRAFFDFILDELAVVRSLLAGTPRSRQSENMSAAKRKVRAVRARRKR
jgi:hypothetical protein